MAGSTNPAQQLAQAARRAGLIYVADTAPGIRRQRRGKRFRYLSPKAQIIRDPATLRRIGSLAVPPAYRDVWICRHARGHLQATGRDARGRKQYRYHAKWRALRDCAKFERMAGFVAALPKLRRQLKHDLALPSLPREKVLAAAVSLLSSTAARVGNNEYARDNNSFGISTLRSRHVSFARGGRAILDFIGKGGVRHEIVVDRRKLVEIMRRCHALPGQHLFQYLDSDGNRHAIDSGMVNAYLSETMGGDFTAKDFRTWHATVHAIGLLKALPVPAPLSARALQRCTLQVLRSVASLLRNTPAVCRKSYVNPELFVAWHKGALGEHFRNVTQLRDRRGERALLRFLRSA
jgi:DNA topoisomerase I